MFPDLIKHTASSLTPDLQVTLEHTSDLAAAAVSDRTRKLYADEFRRFAAWADRHDLPSLPSTPSIVAAYVGSMHKDGRSYSGAALAKAAIRYKHDEARHALDLDTPDMRKVMKGFRRKQAEAGRQTNKAAPFTVAMWQRLVEIGGDNLEARRDVAMLGIGLAHALRGPSELLRLDLTKIGTPDALGSITLTKDGANIALTKTKTSQIEGERLTIEECPATDALRAWIEAADIRPGTPIWRTFRNGALTQARTAQRTLHTIIQRRAAQVLEADGYSSADAKAMAGEFSTHSLRHGALTSLGDAGASIAEVMKLSRHASGSVKIAMGYVKTKNAGQSAMSALMKRTAGKD